MTATEQFSIEFVRSGRGKAQCAPDPAYPQGVDVDVSGGAENSCTAQLPYPAPECGHFLVRCRLCKYSVAVTAAGRPDDPRTLKMPCDAACAGGAA
jgi:hypothetical protein